jgi:tetratricopeptide (TPR) repeat protein
MLGYWFNFQFSHADPYSYHVVNLLLHFANSVLVWLIVARILEWAGVQELLRVLLGIFSGLLFLVHPIQTESVTYVASRSESQSLLFFLAAFSVFIYRRDPAVSAKVAAAVLVLFGAAVATKEHTAVLPALLLLTDFYWNPPFSVAGIRRNWKLYLPMLAGFLAAVAFVARVLRSASSAGFGMADLPWYQYFFTQCRAIWRYLGFFVLPFGLNVDHEFPISRSLVDHGAIFGLLALIVLAVVAWIRRREYPLAGYGYFAFLLLLAPTSSVVPIRDVLVERRIYLAFFPLALICCEFLRRIPIRRMALVAALALVLVVLCGITYARNQVWSDPIALWTDTVAKSPSKSRPAFQLAYALYAAGRCPEAVKQYEKVARLEKPDYSLYVDWGIAADCAQQPQLALEKFQLAAGLEKSAHVYSLMAMVHAKRNERAEALAALSIAEKLDPNFPMTYVYRGNILLLEREFDRAAADFQKALTLSPNDAAARNGLELAQRRVVPDVK